MTPVLSNNVHAILKLAIAQAVDIVAHYAEASLPGALHLAYVHTSPPYLLPAHLLTAMWAV